MSEEEIHKLKIEGMASMHETPVKRKIEIIDTLASYGEKGIPAIRDILNTAMSQTVIEYATDVLEKLQKSE